MTDSKNILEANKPKAVWQTVSCKVPIEIKAEFMKLAGGRGYTINQLIALIVNQAVEHGIDLSKVAEKAEQADLVPGLQSQLTKTKKDVTIITKQLSSLQHTAKAATNASAAKLRENTSLKIQVASLEKQLAKSEAKATKAGTTADANKATLIDAKQKIAALQTGSKKWQQNAKEWEDWAQELEAAGKEALQWGIELPLATFPKYPRTIFGKIK